MYLTTFSRQAVRIERIGVDYFRQLMVIEAITVNILPQHKADHIVPAVQPNLVREDMRHEAGLFFYGSDMNTAFYNLRDKRYGTGQKLVKSMR